MGKKIRGTNLIGRICEMKFRLNGENETGRGSPEKKENECSSLKLGVSTSVPYPELKTSGLVF